VNRPESRVRTMRVMHAATHSPLPMASPTSRPALRPASKRLGHDLLEDWEQVVRSAPPGADPEQLLRQSGYRPYGSHNARPDCTPEDVMASDQRLADLVRAAGTDPFAARVVLQRLLPGITSIARRRGHGQWAVVLECYDDLLANAWIVIRCYPIERRPARVAANLLRDIEYQTFVRPNRLRRVPTTPLDAGPTHRIDALSCPEQRHPFEQLVDVLEQAVRAGLEPEWVGLAAALANGRTIEELAEERSRTTRAERYRRAELGRRIRALVLDDTNH